MKDYTDRVYKLEDGTWCHESSTSELKDMAMYFRDTTAENSLGLDLHSFSNLERIWQCRCVTCSSHFVESRLVITMDIERQALQFSEFNLDLENKGTFRSRTAFIHVSDTHGL